MKGKPGDFPHHQSPPASGPHSPHRPPLGGHCGGGRGLSARKGREKGTPHIEEAT